MYISSYWEPCSVIKRGGVWEEGKVWTLDLPPPQNKRTQHYKTVLPQKIET